eukprot:657561-Pleurochrysis_carterae.AAC.1
MVVGRVHARVRQCNGRARRICGARARRDASVVERGRLLALVGAIARGHYRRAVGDHEVEARRVAEHAVVRLAPGG